MFLIIENLDAQALEVCRPIASGGVDQVVADWSSNTSSYLRLTFSISSSTVR
jgi:hypothetical protein